MKLKDYLHLYLGCKAIAYRSETAFDNVIITPDVLEKAFSTFYLKIIPILRPLSDIQEPEAVDFGYKGNRNYNHWLYDRIKAAVWTVEQFKYLLDNQFDLFGLIHNGFAIDLTTLKETIK